MGRGVDYHPVRLAAEHLRARYLRQEETRRREAQQPLLSNEEEIEMSMVNTAPGKHSSVRNLNFYYGKFHALKNINLDITKNQVTAFIGPSGCEGKSTPAAHVQQDV